MSPCRRPRCSPAAEGRPSDAPVPPLAAAGGEVLQRARWLAREKSASVRLPEQESLPALVTLASVVPVSPA
jgi:hypothetical protein